MMKTTKFLALAVTLFAASSFAEDGMFSGALPKNWNADVLASAQFTRQHYSNWNNGADGVNTNVWILKYDADVIGHFSHFDWRSVVKLEWGQTYMKGLGTRKSNDKIFIETTVAENDFKPFEPYAGLRFESQFAKSYTYTDSTKTPISCFMDPGYFTQMLGVSFAPNDNFRQSIAFANRMTISDGYGWADDADTKKIETFKDEPGLESVTEYKVALSSLASFKTRLWAFVNFKGVDEIDGKWENRLDVTIAPLIVLSVGVDVAYDKDIDEDTQYRDAVTLGITWRWF
ncbi:DUF3078 domain-containing protein [uncultured Fibrobacter sp.]|uniref:DUF3078 domain-containing protein n=1 Tax=uncultured Fibrobacter sp. TaxID=261512 RepID=UPI002804440E|nr:DUF3078 domain-containing protein [uncultured Fibrobacter sp.]